MSVRHGLLGLLAQRPRHGYDLHAAFEALAGGEQNWDVKPAQVYATLSRLEKSGHVREERVEQGSGPEKRTYAITPSGLAELGSWLATGEDQEHQRDVSFLKLMISLAAGGPGPRKVIQSQRAALYKELHSVTTRRNRSDPQSELAQILLLDKAAMHLEADVRWLDLVEARLDDLRRQPMPRPKLRPRGRPKKEPA